MKGIPAYALIGIFGIGLFSVFLLLPTPELPADYAVKKESPTIDTKTSRVKAETIPAVAQLVHGDSLENSPVAAPPVTEEQSTFLEDIKNLSVENITTLLRDPDKSSLLDHQQVITQLFHRLAELSPHDGLALIYEVKPHLQKSALHALFDEWATAQPEEALAAASGLQNSTLRSEALDKTLKVISKTDPPYAFQLAQELNIKRPLLTIFGNWAKLDPLSAFQTASQTKGVHDSVHKLIMSQWAKSNPEDAKAFINTLPPSGERKHALKGLVETLYKQDPSSAITYAETLTQPNERATALGEIYGEYAKTNAAEVANLFLTQGLDKVGKINVQELSQHYARQDINGAQSFISSLNDPKLRKSAISGLMNIWSKTSPLDALAYYQNSPNQAEFKNSLHNLGTQLGKTDPTTALQYLSTQETSNSQLTLLSNVYKGWARIDLESASLSLTYDGANYDSNTLKSIYKSIGSEYARYPEVGADWLNTISDPKLQNQATHAYTTNLAHNNPDAAAEFVESLSSEKQQNFAIDALVNSFAKAEPSVALEWAGVMTDEKRRARKLESTYLTWLKKDEAGAKQWLSSTDLFSYSEKVELRN